MTAEIGNVSEKKRKFDEQTLARVLEAAYVLQEHQHELEDFKSSLELKRNAPATDAERALAAASAPAPPIAFPAPPVSSSDAPVPGASTSPLPFPSPASSMPIASAPIASPAPLTILPVPEPVVTESYESMPAQMPEQMMETEPHLQVQNLDLDAAMALVVGQVIEICGAAGAAIGIVNRRTVFYRSVAGIRTLPAGSEVSVDDALCAPCLQSGEVWRCADTSSERPEHREECRHRGIGSLIAAPVFHEGRTVGALELLFSDPAAFTEHDVQTCQLMAGVITESLARDPVPHWKEAPAAKPAPGSETTSAGGDAEQNAEEKAEEETEETKESYGCYRCGHRLLADEQFCGKCGTPRAGDYEPASMQSKVASLWHMQETKKPESTPPVQPNELPAEPGRDAAQVRPRTSILNLNPTDRSKRTSVPHFGLHDAETNTGTEQPATATPLEKAETKRVSEIDAPAVRTDKALEVLLAPPSPVRADWSSASSARDFLEQVADGAPQNVLLRLWNTRRGDIYLAIAVILVLCVLRWGMWSNHPASPQPSAPPPAASAPRKTAEVELPFSERMLIAMGLAEAPEPPADKGNPSTQVWVDLHTALYYCPGADLYGKTAIGKYTTQREAELDQFQPAYRKTCN